MNSFTLMLRARLRRLSVVYPRQYWLLMTGQLINTIGVGFIWPFLNIYLHDELGLALSAVTILPIIEQSVALFTTLGAGAFADRYGRKYLMGASLGAVALLYALMAFASGWWMFAVLLGLRGFFVPLYRVSADAMVADLITDDERRLPAYSLLRTVNNAGVAIGPVLGGFVAAVSYRASFLTAAAAMGVFAAMVLLMMVETLPAAPALVSPAGMQRKQTRSAAGGYRRIAQDTLFLAAVLAFAFNGMGAALPFQMLGVYGVDKLGLGEAALGWIISVNAIMVVLFQVPVASRIRRYNSLKVLAAGALFYAAGVASMALGQNPLQFGVSMAILTVGELLIAPTFTSFAVNLAPPEMRGRYMSVYWIGWSFSRGVGPAIAGWTYEAVAPAAIWYLGGFWNLVAALIFASLAPAFRRRKAQGEKA